MSAMIASLDVGEHTHEVEQAGTLVELVPAEVGGVGAEDLLDLVRLADVLGANGKEGSDGAGNVRRRHGSAAVLDVGGDAGVALERHDPFPELAGRRRGD